MVDASFWLFISSGLFLGWSLGANNAVTLFGTAVSSKMVRFRVAALVAGACVIAGSVLSGAGTTNTLTDLGGINAIAGSFTAALAVGLAVTWMTRVKIPVSATQAVVGAIIAWNLFTGSPTDMLSLSRIVGSWLVSPLIAGVFSFLIFKALKRTVLKWKIHMLLLDSYTRVGLIIVGALVSYSMGANNIANVMGMFVQAAPVRGVVLADMIHVSGAQLLFLLGGAAIAVGIYTYGHKVMKTVGSDLFKISPITGFAVVLSEFVVLFLFTSQSLETLLLELSLPSIPLVPLSATQVFIGAVIGVGLAKDPQSVDFRVLGKICIGWIVAPLTAGILAFVMLFIVQNVFEQRVIDPAPYELSRSVMQKLKEEGVGTGPLEDLRNRRFVNARAFRHEIAQRDDYSNSDLHRIFLYAVVDSFRIDSAKITAEAGRTLSAGMLACIRRNHGRTFSHRLDFETVMFPDVREWTPTGDILRDKEMQRKKTQIEELMRVRQRQAQ